MTITDETPTTVPDPVLDAVRGARRVLVLSGAGMSAESGVPTFRDAQTGLWEQFDPSELATAEAFRLDPPFVWAWYAWRMRLVRDVEPNAGHRALAELADLPQVQVLDAAHAREHSLEVHLPFLQVALRDFQLVPLVVGDATAAEVAQVLERLWGGPETLIVVSSDLSHYHDYATARRLDRETSRFIQDLSPVPLHGEQACGCRPVSGLLQAARDHGLQARLLDLRSSGDTAGPRDRVVGYGAYAFA